MSDASRADSSKLERNALGTAGVVFLVLAAVAPLGAMVAVAPLGIAFGDGSGMPGAWLLATLALLGFGAGYAAMSRHVTSAGAFYVYIARGLGRPAGLAGAGIAVLAYNAIMISVVGVFGFFTHDIVKRKVGLDLPWEVWVAALLVVVGSLSYREIHISAKVLGVALICETAILLVLDVAILADQGPSAFTLDVFNPSTIFAGAPGVALVFAFYAFIGFEATALFSEECKQPKRTVPRATYVTILLIGTFYVLTSWSLIAGYGADQVQEAATKDPGGLVFAAADRFVGTGAADVMQWLLVSSLFAAVLALHNAASRYFFALGRAGFLPPALGRTHRRHHSPYVATATQLLLTVAVVGAFAIAGADPYLTMAAALSALGTLGIVLLQAGTASAAVAFFRRRRDRRIFTTLIAPAAGAAALVAAAVLVIHNYSVLTGKTSGLTNRLPWLLLIVAAVGLVGALYVRRSHPERYDQMDLSLDAEGAVDTTAPQHAPAEVVS